MTKKYMVFSRDIAPDLKKELPDEVTLKGKVTLGVELSITDAGCKKVSSSPVWLQKANNEANKIVPKAIKAIGEEIKTAKAIDEKSVTKIVEKVGEAAGKRLELAIKAALATWIVDKKEYDMYKVMSATVITLGAIGVTSSVASIAISGGAATPVAIMSLTRSGIGLAQALAKVAMEAEKVERLLRVDVAVLSKAFAKNKDNKALQSMKELGMAGVATALGVDTPTISNFGSRVELYKDKITGLKKENAKLASAIYKLMDMQTALQKKMKAAGKESKDMEKMQKSLATAEKSLDDVLKKVVLLGARIEAGDELQATYAKVAASLSKSVAECTKHAQLAMSLSISLGTSITGIISALESGFHHFEKAVKPD